MLREPCRPPPHMNERSEDDANRSTADALVAEAPGTSPSNTYADQSLRPGTRLADRYALVRLLGQGAMGCVYEASDEKRSGLRVAVKLLTACGPQALYRLKNEFRALAETVHPNLVGLHGLGADKHGWFVVMDLIDPSTNFRSYVCSGANGALDEARLRSALVQLVRGVAAIHAAGKLHRDLKPSNVLVTREGRVVISDFGLVGEQDSGGIGSTREGWFAGTPAYAAPEQAEATAVGAKADLYAVGVLLFEALTGRLPIVDESSQRLLERKLVEQAPDPRSLAPNAPADLCALCATLLQRNPALRPDAQELLVQLEQAPLSPAPVASLPFVGRERELALLFKASSRARAGSPAVAVISGSSGIGKTALVTRFLELTRREPGTVVLKGRCHALEQVPYNAFDNLVDALGRHLAKLSPLDAVSLMPREIALLARLFPTLSRVPAVLLMPPGPTREFDAPWLRTRAFAALKELLARIADRSPLIVCIDDMQWSDDDSNELLRELLREPDAPACLFLCAFRTSEPSENRAIAILRSLAEWPCVDLELAPLDTAASTELARAMLVGGGCSDADLCLIVEESAGSPFLLKELARGARSCGQVSSLRETVAASSAKLAAEARTLLELVCAAGQPLEPGFALRAARVGPQALPEVLASCLLRTSIHCGREHLESSHDRVGEAVLEGLDTAWRTELHTRLAQQLTEEAEPDPELIAQHYRAAGLASRAAPYTIRAAERARDALAYGRAAELYTVALSEASDRDQSALELALADTYASLGKLSEAAEHYEHVQRRSDLHEQRRSLAAKAMLLYLLAGRLELGARLADELCRQLGVRPRPRRALLAFLVQSWLVLRYLLGPRITSLPVPSATEGSPLLGERIQLYVQASRGFSQTSPDHSVYFGLRALISIRRDRDARWWPLAVAGEVMWRCAPRGVLRERDQRDNERAVALAEAQGDPELLAMVLRVKGTSELFTCHIRSAAQTFERAEGLLAACGHPVIQDINGIRNGRLTAWIMSGQLNELVRYSETWIAEAQVLGDQFGALTARVFSAHRFLALDAPEAARHALADLDAAAARATALPADPWWVGEVELYEADFEAALAEYERARRSRFFRAMQRFSAHRTGCAHYLARACLMAAQQAKRAEHIRKAERQMRSLEREGCAVGPAAAAHVRGSLAMLRGDQAGALTELTQAADMYLRCGSLLFAAATRYRVGLMSGGDQGAALVTAARSAAQALGAQNPERWFRSLAPGFPD